MKSCSNQFSKTGLECLIVRKIKIPMMVITNSM